MKLCHLHFVLPLLYGTSISIPVDGNLSRRGLQVVHTSTTRDGIVIDWVPRDSQTLDGSIAAPPPLPAAPPVLQNQTALTPSPLLEEEEAELGPEGTVPVARLPDAQAQIIKGPPVSALGEPQKRAVGDHWYASSAENVAHLGGSAIYSLYKAWTQAGSDFSLLQTAIIRYNVPKPGDNSQTVMQTAEAGWINYPDQESTPHLFTFFTTDGYASNADNKGGWNRDVAGWVQVDTAIFPGTTFSPLSTIGGAQYEIKIQWLLYSGNWWLYVLDRWIGYYPASLYSAGTTASSSLATQGNAINYYGEIYDSHPQLTTTDMGSGAWPEGGWQQSAYIRNMVYTDLNGADQTYNGAAGQVVSDTNRYRMVADYTSGGSWGSNMYLGGPGAGGVVNG